MSSKYLLKNRKIGNMPGGQQTLDFRHLLYPKCPYNDSVIILVTRLGVIALGTIGLSFLNIWVGILYLVYSVVFNVLIWPIKH
ncbi:MAG: hypothetical protein ACFFDT_25550, partial [Candidatus Hodarchaeota archaeon]